MYTKLINEKNYKYKAIHKNINQKYVFIKDLNKILIYKLKLVFFSPRQLFQFVVSFSLRE